MATLLKYPTSENFEEVMSIIEEDQRKVMLQCCLAYKKELRLHFWQRVVIIVNLCAVIVMIADFIAELFLGWSRSGGTLYVAAITVGIFLIYSIAHRRISDSTIKTVRQGEKFIAYVLDNYRYALIGCQILPFYKAGITDVSIKKEDNIEEDGMPPFDRLIVSSDKINTDALILLKDSYPEFINEKMIRGDFSFVDEGFEHFNKEEWKSFVHDLGIGI